MENGKLGWWIVVDWVLPPFPTFSSSKMNMFQKWFDSREVRHIDGKTWKHPWKTHGKTRGKDGQAPGGRRFLWSRPTASSFLGVSKQFGAKFSKFWSQRSIIYSIVFFLLGWTNRTMTHWQNRISCCASLDRLLDTKKTWPDTSPPFRILEMVEMNPRTRWFETEAWPDVSESQWACAHLAQVTWSTWFAHRKDGKLIGRWSWKGPSIIYVLIRISVHHIC